MPPGSSVSSRLVRSVYRPVQQTTGVDQRMDEAKAFNKAFPNPNVQWNMTPEQFLTWGTQRTPQMNLSQRQYQNRADTNAMIATGQINMANPQLQRQMAAQAAHQNQQTMGP